MATGEDRTMGKNDDAALRAARQRLNKLPKNASAKDYKAANDAAIAAEKNVSWWKR